MVEMAASASASLGSRRDGSRPQRTCRRLPIFPKPMDRQGSSPPAAPEGVVLDMDSSVSPSARRTGAERVWNGHYECTCYHPLFVFNQFGDLERCALRPGNVHSADEWEERC